MFRLEKLVIIYFAAVVGILYCQNFTDIGAGLTGVTSGSQSWGDYDNDGDLDILITGYSNSGCISKIYRNDSGVFVDINAGLTGVASGTSNWIDYDNDGDLDILLTGATYTERITRLYNNNNGIFTVVNSGLPGRDDADNGGDSVAWGDYDNDGDQDVLITGRDYFYNLISRIYKNNNGTFTDINAGLQPVEYGSVAWGDYDNDGDLDILLTGMNYPSYVSIVYRNDGEGIFTNINAGLTGMLRSSVAWGDYDNDGDLDILLAGADGSSNYLSKIYNNNNGIFTEIGDGLVNIAYNCVAWGDYDNDGDLDILLTGSIDYDNYITRIYRNNGNGTFSNINAGLIGVDFGSCAWGDYDNDGDLDVIITGQDVNDVYVTKIYRNNSATANTAPQQPTGLTVAVYGDKASFSWDRSTDPQTPQSGLTYNLYTGTTSGNCDVNSPMSNILTGYREIASSGNCGLNNSWSVKNLSSGIYYWGVQTVDNTFAGSSFNSANTFFTILSTPVALNADNIFPKSFKANWEAVQNAEGYKIDVDNDINFSSPLNDYNGLDAGAATSLRIAGLNPDSTYYYRVAAYTKDGTSFYSDTITVRTLPEFSNFSSGLVNVSYGSSAWGDYDNDGDLDIIVTGDSGSGYISYIYRNDNGVFANINAGLVGTAYGSSEWGDFDNDGDLDILITGMTATDIVSVVYRNDGNGIFTDIAAGLTGVRYSSAAWGDYDNDGDLDILLAGDNAYEPVSILYDNSGDNIFMLNSNFNTNVPGARFGSVAFSDYDLDADLDIVITGETWEQEKTMIFKNDGNGFFTDINAGLTGVRYSSSAWGDYDSDGDPDVLITGSNSALTGQFSILYRNDGNDIFTGISSGLTGVYEGTATFGDYDNDGDLDILLSGYADSEPVSMVYRNDGDSIFTDISAGLSGVCFSSSAWGDCDNDGDLDILISGNDFSGEKLSGIYINNSETKNTKPAPPSVLNVIFSGNYTIASWNRGYDLETLPAGVSYNAELICNGEVKTYASSDPQSGYRRLAAIGNTGSALDFLIDLSIPFPLLPMENMKRIITKIQSVDNCFAGSEFAVSDTTIVSDTLEVISKNIMLPSDYLSWEYVYPDSIVNYQIQIDDNVNFENPYNETVLLLPKNIIRNEKTLFYNLALNEIAFYDSLISNETYYWRMKPVYKNSKRVTSFKGNPLSFIYDPIYSAPSPVSISVEGNYVTLQWGTGKEGEKTMLYNIYSSDDPHAVFPEGWTLVNSVTGTSYVLNSTLKKKFYCVTAAGAVK